MWGLTVVHVGFEREHSLRKYAPFMAYINPSGGVDTGRNCGGSVILRTNQKKKTSRSSNPTYGAETDYKTLALCSFSGSISITVEASTP
jgi:hypothetical protein